MQALSPTIYPWDKLITPVGNTLIQKAHTAFMDEADNHYNKGKSNYIGVRVQDIRQRLTAGSISLNEARERVLALMEVADLLKDGRLYQGHMLHYWNPKRHGFSPWLKLLALPVRMPLRPHREPEADVVAIDPASFAQFFPYSGGDADGFFIKLARWAAIWRQRQDDVPQTHQLARGEIVTFGGARTKFFKEILCVRRSGELVFNCESEDMGFKLALAIAPAEYEYMKMTVKWSFAPHMTPPLQIEDLLRAQRRMIADHRASNITAYPDVVELYALEMA